MNEKRVIRGNVLGDLSAEADHRMLEKSFYLTPDVRSLIGSSDKILVVGRRGTGKSALAYYLDNHYRKVDHTRVVNLALEEDQVIGMCPLLARFGTDYRRIAAACKIAWRYALLLEVATDLANHFKFSKADHSSLLTGHIKNWRVNGISAVERLRRKLKSCLKDDVSPEEQIADLASGLEIKNIESAMVEILGEMKFSCVLLIDRLDEGYKPDDTGTGLVSGLAEAAIYLNSKFDQIRPILFLRDNMFRTMAHLNPDYSRNIEGHVLRIHWDEYALNNMIVNRLRIAFSITEESTL